MTVNITQQSGLVLLALIIFIGLIAYDLTLHSTHERRIVSLETTMSEMNVKQSAILAKLKITANLLEVEKKSKK